MRNMKFSKYLVYFLFFVFCVPTAMSMTSCEPSYRNMRKFSKKKRASSKRKKAYSQQRRAKQRASRPINTSYMMKTKRRTTYHY